MKQLWHEFRCAIVELLFNVQLWLVPDKSTEQYTLSKAVKYYFAEMEAFKAYHDDP